jgi:hypothetical protein
MLSLITRIINAAANAHKNHIVFLFLLLNADNARNMIGVEYSIKDSISGYLPINSAMLVKVRIYVFI